MRRKRLLFAVNLILIACLVLSPMAVFAQDAEVQPDANASADVSTPAEGTSGDTGSGDSGETQPAGEPIENAGSPEGTGLTGSSEQGEGADDKGSDDTASGADTPSLTALSDQAQSDSNIGGLQSGQEEPQSEEAAGNEGDEVKPASNESSAQGEGTPDQSQTLGSTAGSEEVAVELDLSKGDVRVTDEGTDDNPSIRIAGKKSDGTDVNQSVDNGSTIRVNQASNPTAVLSNVITITLEKFKSFVTVILDSLNIKTTDTRNPIDVEVKKEDSTVTLELDGTNDIETTGARTSAIGKTGEGTLVIQDTNGDKGKLEADNSSVSGAPAIGGYSGEIGSIKISNAEVDATSNKGAGAAIGAGKKGTVNEIVIENSDVTAVSKGSGSAAISGSSITINNSDVEAEGKKAAIQGELKTDSLKDVVDTDSKTFSSKAAVPISAPVVVPNQPNDDNTDEEEVIQYIPVVVKKDATDEKKTDTLVEAKKDDAVLQSNVEITDATAKITVTDNTGEQIEPKEVTIKSVAAFEETGASEASIQLTAKLIVDVDVATMKEAAAQTGSTADVVTVTNEDSVITVKSGGAELVSVDVKAVVDATEETVTVKFGTNTVKVIFAGTVYDIDLTGLTDLGTLTLKIENGVLKIYDKAGNLIKEVVKA